MSKTINYIFLLILVLILVVYFKGTTKISQTLFGGAQSIINTLQGRKSDGTFANYPQE